MTQDLIDRSRKRHTLTDTALFVLIAALAIALIVAAIVVSIGMARADTLRHIAASGGGRVALALFVALTVAGISAATAATMRGGELPQRRD